MDANKARPMELRYKIGECERRLTFGLAEKKHPFPHFLVQEEKGNLTCVDCWKQFENMV